MFKHNYLPNDLIIKEILAICDIYHYPAYLKYTIDNFVINKKIRLSSDNFTYYIQILSNFKETTDYVHNLINTSSDLGYQIKAEFFEYIVYNNLVEGEFDKVEKNINNLRERYQKDYQNASEIQFYGNTLMLSNFNEFIKNLDYKEQLGLENDEHDNLIKNRFWEQTEKLYSVFEKLVEENKANKKWIESKVFIQELITLYEMKPNGFDQLCHIYKSLLESNKKMTLLTKDNFSNYMRKLIKEKVVKGFPSPFEVFQHCLKDLTFDQLFEIIRYENLFIYQRIFNRNKLGDQFDSFLNLTVDNRVMDRLHDVDRRKLNATRSNKYLFYNFRYSGDNSNIHILDELKI
jgi:hypothetical protein